MRGWLSARSARRGWLPPLQLQLPRREVRPPPPAEEWPQGDPWAAHAAMAADGASDAPTTEFDATRRRPVASSMPAGVANGPARTPTPGGMPVCPGAPQAEPSTTDPERFHRYEIALRRAWRLALAAMTLAVVALIAAMVALVTTEASTDPARTAAATYELDGWTPRISDTTGTAKDGVAPGLVRPAVDQLNDPKRGQPHRP